MISAQIEKHIYVSTLALDYAHEKRRASLLENSSCSEALGARALFLAQIVASIATLPLNLLALLFAPAFLLCFEGKQKAWTILNSLSLNTLLHISLIPTCLIAAFTPHSWECLFPSKQLMACLPEF